MAEKPFQTQPIYNNIPKQKKLKTIKIALAVIIAIGITVVAAILFLFQDDPSKFYGTWELKIAGFDFENSTTHNYWTFYENGKFKITEVTTSFNDDVPIIRFNENDEQRTFNVKSLGPKSEQWGTYEVSGGKLHIKGTSDIGVPIGIGLDYDFINDNQFTINFMMFQLNFDKTVESAIPDPTYNFENIEWKDINISVSTGYGSPGTVHWDWIQLTRSSTPYSGEHAPTEWGDVKVGDEIEIGDYQSEFITISLTWIPTNENIETIFFYGE